MKRIIPGPNAVTEALGASPSSIEVIYMLDSLNPKTAHLISMQAKKSNVVVEPCSKGQLDAIGDGIHHQGVIAITGSYSFVSLEDLLTHANKTPAPLIVVLDQIQDPGNLGAVVRSAHALGASGLIITKDRSATMTAAAIRASAGASERTRIARVTNLARTLEILKDAEYRIYGAAGEAPSPVDRMDWSGHTALVLGNEGKGMRRLTRENCDALFSIPMKSDFESLNVSAAAAIAMYEAIRQKNQQ